MRKAISEGRQDLWSRYQRTRSKVIRNQLVEKYLPLVRGVAERVTSRLPKFIDPDDMMSAGTCGLLKAIDGFDPSRGTRFETYCRLRVRGSMLDELRSQDWIPREARNKEALVVATLLKLRERLGREPTQQEIASALGLSVEDMKLTVLQVAISNIVSLSMPELDHINGSGSDLGDRLPLADDEPSKIAHRNEIVDLIYGSLSPLEKMIIVFYYHEELTMKEIGEVLQVSESRVCQIHARMLDRLKERFSEEY